jgi:hypothetical protein
MEKWNKEKHKKAGSELGKASIEQRSKMKSDQYRNGNSS